MSELPDPHHKRNRKRKAVDWTPIEGEREEKRRLQSHFRTPRSMRSYVRRMRSLEGLDLGGLDGAVAYFHKTKQMRSILRKKKIASIRIESAIDATLRAAARYELWRLQVDQADAENIRAGAKLDRLLRQIGRLQTQVCGTSSASLSKTSKGAVNGVIAQVHWENFDTEIYAETVQNVVQCLKKASPPRAAQQALATIYGPLRLSKHPSARRLALTGTPAMIVLWETMPDETRGAVEKELRFWKPPARAELAAFLDALAESLRRHKPKGEAGRREGIEQDYLKAVEGIWVGLGLTPGLAKGGSKHRRPESLFQRFARLGLNAVGNSGAISERQVNNVRSAKLRSLQQAVDNDLLS